MLHSNFKTAEKALEYEALYSKVMELWNVDYKGYYIDTSYGKTWIHEAGNENLPPLLLLHGMSGSSTLWYPNVEYLSKYFRVIMPDIIGQAGKSMLEKPLTSPADLEKWLDEVIIDLKINQLYLGGMSFGGWLAARYAIYAPHRVAKLIMIDPAATFIPFNAEFYFRMFAAVVIPVPRIGKSFEYWLTQGYKMNPDFSRQIAIGMMDYKPMKGQKTIIAKAIHNEDLRKLVMPVKIMFGEQCVMYNLQKAIQKAKSLLPHVDIDVISNSAHSVNMEQADVVNELIAKFIL
jgi:pimeloyl-ACP methyl ester carboxylesterase